MYDKSVGRNANLMLGAVPNADGLIPEADFQRYTELGREIRRRFDAPLAQTDGKGASLELTLPKPANIDHVVIMEDIAQGERVRRYVVDGWGPGNEWHRLCDGVSIGHKRIQWFDAVEVAKVRLRLTESIAEPVVRRLAVYSTA